MRNFYQKKIRIIGVLSLLILGILNVQAQLVWNGSVSTSPDEPDNWTPSAGVAGQTITIPMKTYNNDCVFDAKQSYSIADFYCDAPGMVVEGEDTTYHDRGVLTIDIGNENTFTVGMSESYYTNGKLFIKSGNVVLNKNKNYYLENDTSEIEMTGGTLRTGTFLMGKSTDVRGGKMVLSGDAVITVSDIFRWQNGMPINRSYTYITDDAKMICLNDRLADMQTAIASGHIRTSADRDVVVYYDALNSQTILTSRLKTAFVIEPLDRQVLVAGEEGSLVYGIDNDGLNSMESIEWKYGTSAEGPFDTSFSPAQTNDSIKPIFEESGDFYLALTGVKGGTDYVSETIVNCLVASNKAIVTPDIAQNIRVNEIAEMLTVTETPAGTSREWKYSAVPGGPYVSFDPQVTGTEFNANFTEIGSYFVVCESVIDGKTERSKEVQFNIVAATGSLNMQWLGTTADVKDMFNWDPAAHIQWNNLIVKDVSVPFMPVITSPGSDTINDLQFTEGATFTINKPSLNDTLNLRKGEYVRGSIIVEGGVFTKTSNYFRLDVDYATVVVKNDAQCIFENEVIMANRLPSETGGRFIIQDNAIVYFLANVWRVETGKSGVSEFELSGNAKYVFTGDRRGTLATWVNGILFEDADTSYYTSYPKFLTPEGFAPYMVYDAIEDVTVITARDLSAFAIEQTETQIVGKGQLTNELSLINKGSYTSFEWVYASTGAGPWNSFDPQITGETARVSFTTTGITYVACKADGAIISSNAVPVNVIDISVTPADMQVIPIDADGTELSVTLPEGATGIQWKYATTEAGPYNEFNPQEVAATYLPWGDEFMGNHFIVFEATVLGDDGLPVTVYSNAVKIVIGTDGLLDNKVETLSVYPNPSDGDVTISGADLGAYTVQVIDLNGGVVETSEVAGGDTTISISESGIYVVKVISENTAKVARVVIQ